MTLTQHINTGVLSKLHWRHNGWFKGNIRFVIYTLNSGRNSSMEETDNPREAS